MGANDGDGAEAVRRFKPYAAYKDSGVEWLGKIPAHWALKRLKYLAELNPSVPKVKSLQADAEVSFLPMEAIGENGGLDLSTSKAIGAVGTGYTCFAENDVVLAKITPCFENGKGAHATGLLNGVAYGTTELHVLRPRGGIDPRFLFYLTLSPTFRRQGEGAMYGAGGQKRVPESFVAEFPALQPPPMEQRAIAAFLDLETARIDMLVAKKERLIELLEERRITLVSQAVMRGLNDAVPRKVSGVEWLGAVPVHWGVVRCKALMKEVDRRSTTGDETLLSLRMSRGLVPHNEVSDKPMKAEDLVGYKIVSEGEIVVNRMRASSGLVAVADCRGLVSPDYAVFRPGSLADPEYYASLFRTPLMQAVFRSKSTGLGTGEAGFLRLYSEVFLSLMLPMPPLEEQAAVVREIRRQLTRIDAMIVHVREATLRLGELRGSIVASAVTGGINVQATVP